MGLTQRQKLSAVEVVTDQVIGGLHRNTLQSSAQRAIFLQLESTRTEARPLRDPPTPSRISDWTTKRVPPTNPPAVERRLPNHSETLLGID